LAVEVAGGLPPGQVMDDGEVVAPEDGHAVRNREQTGVDEAVEGKGPRFAGAETCGRPVLLDQYQSCYCAEGERGTHQSLRSRFSAFRSNTGRPVAVSLSRSSI
jgi:hypothetical protein